MKIAIIGMGIAGTSALREWTKKQRLNSAIKITVFSDEHTFGTGKAFQQDDPRLIMNQAAKFTSIDPDNDYDFAEWIKACDGDDQPETKYYPRAKFGAYIKERMNSWLAESNADIIQEQVESVRIINNHYRVSTRSFTADFDAVHLCTGTLPYKDPYKINHFAHAIANPFPMEKKLAKIPHGATVGVIGTGLTSIDIFRYTSAHRPDINLLFFSLSGTFKAMIGGANRIKSHYFTKEAIDQALTKNNGTIPLETYLKWFKQELDYHDISLDELLTGSLGSKSSLERQLTGTSDIGKIQAVLSNITFYQTDLWMALTEADKRKFKAKYDVTLDKLQAAFPKETAKHFISAWNNNEFKVYNNLIDIKKNDQSFTFKLKNAEPIHIDYVINATGNNRVVSHDMKHPPLIRQLVNERILQPEVFGGVQVTMPELSAVSQKYGVLHTLKAHGQLIAGIQYGNSSVRIISKSVKASVEDIFNRLEERKMV